MAKPFEIIFIQPAAPPKPLMGEGCNGCGVCCLVEPCPLGVVLSGRRQGACAALRWNAPAAIYRCGAMSQPREVLEQALPRLMRALAPALAPWLARLARRWIAAGAGCDSSLEARDHPD